jgi:hypothetical protein
MSFLFFLTQGHRLKHFGKNFLINKTSILKILNNAMISIDNFPMQVGLAQVEQIVSP